MLYEERQLDFKIGDMVIMRGDKKNLARWKFGILTGKSHLDRAVQQLYSLELSCNQALVNNSTSYSQKDISTRE